MIKFRRAEVLWALVFILPFVAVYAVWFIFPTAQMVYTSLTDSKLTGGTGADFIGLANYIKLFRDKLFGAAVWNTSYFVLLTVVPNTLIGLAIALMVARLKGWMQSIILAMFFLPFILPVSVVYLVWQFVLDLQFGIAQYVIEPVVGRRIPVFREIPWFLPTVAWITIWWTNGFNVLLYLAGIRAISPDLYEAASLDGATRWQKFTRITWPLIWPVTALVLTIQLILQLKIFDQVYLYSIGGRADATMTMVQYIYKAAFVQNKAGFGAAAATVLFAVVVVFSILQFQLLRGGRK